MKKAYRIAAALLLCAALFAGCGVSAGPVTLSEAASLPPDGILTADTLRTLKKENRIALYNGCAGVVCYQWTVFGTAAAPEDTSLSLTIEECTESALQFGTAADLPEGSAELTLFLPLWWEADRAALSRERDGVWEEISSAALCFGENTVVSVSLPGAGHYRLEPVSGSGPDAAEERLCTVSVECSAIFPHIAELTEDKLEALPPDGIVLAAVTVPFEEGESAFDVLQRVCREHSIHLESSWTPLYESAYIEGIHNLYEFDCGSLSGWMFRVNGWYPNFGCSQYELAPGDRVEWRFTCDLGSDIGGGYAAAP